MIQEESQQVIYHLVAGAVDANQSKLFFGCSSSSSSNACVYVCGNRTAKHKMWFRIKGPVKKKMEVGGVCCKHVHYPLYQLAKSEKPVQ